MQEMIASYIRPNSELSDAMKTEYLRSPVLNTLLAVEGGELERCADEKMRLLAGLHRVREHQVQHDGSQLDEGVQEQHDDAGQEE